MFCLEDTKTYILSYFLASFVDAKKVETNFQTADIMINKGLLGLIMSAFRKFPRKRVRVKMDKNCLVGN